ncbi:efflux RND transporter periplasmic adaptor subunit [Devosia sp. XJ19-1]|uniref:Efflux RND transporter periplasmic adaptor subunit n=1 Tax=Devosia ureilytica TaxID=2952754 RepID=A0A9Q4APW8_9HYPH|nr:efflux RND transporter periplasmic adaptor subunit [Devosia ureilytica]MCP8884067.1 efflux RND transporter periplasmic adaptor subunit [Devosia ureilytica]MCP8887675.1 efflux RND transporter periplasmic adaptor subunit [Devosia ureilytica]
MKTFAKWLLTLVVIGGAGAAGWWYFLAPTQASTVPDTVSVERGDIEMTVLASGVLEASALVSVGAEVSGTIKAVHVTLGQEVRRGDLIAEIDSLNQENAVKSAEAALAGIEAQRRNQEANLVAAEASLVRQQQLSANSLVSQTALETAQAAVEQAKAQIDQLNAQLAQAELTVESAELNLARTQIVAPADGTVVALLVEEGQTLNANSATPTIAKIANLDTMVIKAEISEADVVKVSAGQKVYFTILGEPDQRIEATLREIEPAPTSIADETASAGSAVYYNGLFEVPNPDHRLRISMTASVTIVLAEARGVLTLPSSLVGRRGPDGGAVVTVYDPQTEETRQARVEIGLNNNISAEIISGLAEGEQVVNATGARLTTGGAQSASRFGGASGMVMMRGGGG